VCFLCQIVVGTPGTVKNWIMRMKYLDPRKVNVFVLDEADKMVEEKALGAETMQIRNLLHKDVQILFFSATYTPEVLNYARKVRLSIQFPLREIVSLITRLS
jgi:ATP-dependent RNA helicase DDX19/DBP5